MGMLTAMLDDGLGTVEGEEGLILCISLTNSCWYMYYVGETHKRHRNVMRSAFGAAEARALLPIFTGCAAKVRLT